MTRMLSTSTTKRTSIAASMVAASMLFGACSNESSVTGSLSINGSSVMNPMAKRAVASFHSTNAKANVTLAEGGTTVGIQEMCERRVEIALASRSMTPLEEQLCSESNVAVAEFVVAMDGISLYVHPSNPLDCISMEELSKVWRDQSIQTWSQLNPKLSKKNIVFFGADELSGTYAIFTQRVNGKVGRLRPDVDKNVNMAIAVDRVAANPNAFGFSTSGVADPTKVKTLMVSTDKSPCVAPDTAHVRSREYPLSRDLFLYARKGVLNRPEVASFLDNYLNNAESFAKAGNLVPVSPAQKNLAIQNLASLKRSFNA
jgi:phosphate transport system substrate-binding protein